MIRYSSFILALLSLLFIAAASTLRAQAPPNDVFANRITLNGTNIIVVGSNTNATKEPGEPGHAGNSGGKSVWWTWTAPTNGDLVINTDGSDFDTLLGVYTGSTVSSLSLVASNDDHGLMLGPSRVRFQAISGAHYQIAVDGLNDGVNIASGNVTLNLVFVSEPIARPPNDNFTNRIVLTGPYPSTSGSNVEATREPGEPLHAGRQGDTSVWCSWTAPAADTVRIATDGSSFDTVLAIYTGASVSNLTLVAANDDEDPLNAVLTSAVTIDTTAGQTYQIAVDGFDGASGQISLRIGSAKTRLSAPTARPDGSFQFTLEGLAGRTNEIQVSSDLSAWAPLATVINTNGTLVFTDPAAASFEKRFYRAFLRP